MGFEGDGEEGAGVWAVKGARLRREEGVGEEEGEGGWGGGVEEDCRGSGVGGGGPLAGRGLVEGEGGGYCGGDVQEEGEGVGGEYEVWGWCSVGGGGGGRGRRNGGDFDVWN